MENQHPTKKPQLLLYLKVGVFWLISNTLNYAILEPTIDKIFDLKMPLITQHIIALMISLIALSYLIWRILQINREEERLKRNDFIETLINVLEIEKRLTVNSICNHAKGLKDDFITPLRESLKKDELDKDKLIELLEDDFNHHTTAFPDTKNIDKLIDRLERHKSGEIIHDIRYEKEKSKEKK